MKSIQPGAPGGPDSPGVYEDIDGQAVVRLYELEEVVTRKTSCGIVTQEMGLRQRRGPDDHPAAAKGPIHFGHGSRATVNYSFDALVHCGTCLTCSPVFLKKFVWLQAGMCVATAIIIGWSPVGPDAGKEQVERMVAASNYFSAIVGFSFGYYVFSEVNRWWEVYSDLYKGLTGHLIDLAMYASRWTPDNTFADDHFKAQLLRCGLALHALLFQHLRNENHNVDDLVARDLLTPDGAEKLRRSPLPPLTMVVWIGALFDSLAAAKRWPELTAEHRREAVEVKLVDMRACITQIVHRTTTNLPLSLVHLLAVLLKMQLLFMVLSTGLSIRYGISQGTSLLSNVTQLIFVFVTPVVLQSFIEITDDLHNPFGADVDDIPQLSQHSKLRDLMLEMFNGAECLPEALAQVYDRNVDTSSSPRRKNKDAGALPLRQQGPAGELHFDIPQGPAALPRVLSGGDDKGTIGRVVPM